MKDKFLVAAVAITLSAAWGHAATNTVVEAKITNSTLDLIRYRSAFTRITKVERSPGNIGPRKSTILKAVAQVAPGALVTFRFDNLGLNIDGEHGIVTCDSARYACTITTVRDDCNEKRCLFGYSIAITKK